MGTEYECGRCGLTADTLQPCPRCTPCQVADPGVVDLLPCPHTESVGYRCEVVGEHSEHGLTAHTIAHSLAGNGYACASLPRPGST